VPSLPDSAAGRPPKTLSIVLACVVGVALIALAAIWGTRSPARQTLPKAIVGTRDEIYYSHSATNEDAVSLGHALQATGFLNDRGTTVLLSKGTAGTIVSFVLNEGAWNRADTVLSFEEIGRRVANSVGGFPIKVRLIDAAQSVHKELNVGKVMAGGRDEVYYFGSATQAEAEALGRALASNGYLVGAGASVLLSKDLETVISFVVEDGSWDRPGTVAGFASLAQKAAASVGGLPIDLRLLNSKMEVKKQLIGIH
jgi:hypothetical protein